MILATDELLSAPAHGTAVSPDGPPDVAGRTRTGSLLDEVMTRPAIGALTQGYNLGVGCEHSIHPPLANCR